MKKIYLLLLLLTGLTGFAFAPPVLNQPTNVDLCDGDTFNLADKRYEVLNGLDDSLYTTTFHYTQANADANVNPITDTNQFTVGTDTRIFVRVQANANPSDFSVVNFWVYLRAWTIGSVLTADATLCGNAAVTFRAVGNPGPYTFYYKINGNVQNESITTTSNTATIYLHGAGNYEVTLQYVATAIGTNCYQYSDNEVNIVITPGPNAGQPNDLIIDQPVASGNNAVFNLTNNATVLTNGQSGVNIVYYATYADVEHNTNPISSLSSTSYSAANDTQIWARVVNATGCYTIKTFHLYVRHPEADFIFIPDTKLKTRLVITTAVMNFAGDLNGNGTVVDTNHDNEIQYTEAANISRLILDTTPGTQGYYNLIGLEAFYNMKNLSFSTNPDVTELDLTPFPLLEWLQASECSINALNFSNCPNLKWVQCYSNKLTSLDFSASPLITEIECGGNQLTTLNLANLTLLQKLDARSNNLTAINTADLNSIEWLFISDNNLTSLDVSGLDTMEYLYCDSNQISTLATTNCSSLTSLLCENNLMTELDVSGAPNLQSINCGGNAYVNLDFSQNPTLCSLYLGETPNTTLSWINVKNGANSCSLGIDVSFAQNLKYLCCDEHEVTGYKNYFQGNGMNVNVNTYCTFSPGGEYNTINANTKYDSTGNGCDVNDDDIPNMKFTIFDGTNGGATFTDGSGLAQFFTLAGNFTVTPSIENQSWFSVSPPSVVIPFSNTENNTAAQNFCIAPNGIHPDLEVILAPVTTARPGFTAYYNLVVRNKGNQTITQPNAIHLFYDIEKLDFLSAQPSPAEQIQDFLTWDLDEFSPFETRNIMVSMRVHAPTDSSPVNLDDVLSFEATVDPVDGDETPDDNNFGYNQIVVGSFDPNEIVCLEGNIVSPIEIGNYLHYTINFENTGTADAENIVVRETIDPTQFDVSSLQLLGSSASVTTRLTGNVAEFIFPNINLHSGGHGNILIKVKSKSTLVAGDTVSKKADIYFDYNFPVQTLPENTVFQTLNTPGVDQDASIKIYPNPTKGIINVNCDNRIKSVQLYDLQGRLLQTSMINETQTTIDISSQSSGVYFLKIVSDKGIGVQRIIRE